MNPEFPGRNGEHNPKSASTIDPFKIKQPNHSRTEGTQPEGKTAEPLSYRGHAARRVNSWTTLVQRARSQKGKVVKDGLVVSVLCLAPEVARLVFRNLLVGFEWQWRLSLSLPSLCGTRVQAESLLITYPVKCWINRPISAYFWHWVRIQKNKKGETPQ